MDIFINNLNSEMNYRFQLQSPPSFDKIFENGIKNKEALLIKGELILYKDTRGFSSNTNTNTTTNKNDMCPSFG